MGNAQINDSQTVTGQPSGPYNSYAYSAEAYDRACFMSFPAKRLAGIAAGLCSDTTPSATLAYLDYGIRVPVNTTTQLFVEAPNAQIPIANIDGSVEHHYQIVYDGQNMRYYCDNNLIRTTPQVQGANYRILVTFELPTSITNIHFGPMGEKGPTGNTGTTGHTGATGSTGATVFMVRRPLAGVSPGPFKSTVILLSAHLPVLLTPTPTHWKVMSAAAISPLQHNSTAATP
jgi:hypothetical protein